MLFSILRVGWIDQHGHASGRGHQFTQQFQPFRRQLPAEKIGPGQVTVRPGEAGDQTKPDRVVSDDENDAIVVVAALAAIAEARPPGVTTTATCRRTKSAASSGSRSVRFSAQRYSIAAFCPSAKPVSFRPWRNPRRRPANASGDLGSRNPITGIACCAHAASGRAVAPPSSVAGGGY